MFTSESRIDWGNVADAVDRMQLANLKIKQAKDAEFEITPNKELPESKLNNQ